MFFYERGLAASWILGSEFLTVFKRNENLYLAKMVTHTKVSNQYNDKTYWEISKYLPNYVGIVWNTPHLAQTNQLRNFIII